MTAKTSLVRLLLASSLLLGAPLAALGGDTWPHSRGPALDGSLDAAGTFDADAIGLDLVWRIPLGSAYSGIAVADGRAVTLFADADGDWVAAFDVEDGKTLWRHRLGDPSAGHDGSDDGPLSSPVIGDGKVYVLSPTGGLSALGLTDGKVVWTKGLDDFGSEAPFFGFTTTPLFVDGILIVQAGGSKGRSIVGLDARTGKRKWAYGDAKVVYQSPILMTLAGKTQVVAVGNEEIAGLEPGKGTVLWTHAFGEEDRAGTAVPVPIGEDRFLLIVSGDAAAFRVTSSNRKLSVEEVYRTSVLGGRTYSPPVYHDGHVYGFRGQILTCMNAETGERVWRSRPPGGDGLILVDGHLVIFGAKGTVVVAEATPDGYRERASVKALEGSGLTWPSFAGDRVFVRNLDEMAAVSVSRGVSAAVDASDAAEHAFGQWIGQVEQADDGAEMVDAFFARHHRTPVIEGGWVHFVYRDPDASEVAIAGSMNDTENPEAMSRVEGTGLYYRSYELEPGSRWEYHYQVDFEEWKTDPNNPSTVPALEGDEVLSEVTTPGYRAPDFLDEPKGPGGTLEAFDLTSEVLGYDKKIRVWLPPGYADSDHVYPLLIVNDGDAWVERGLMPRALDNLVGTSVAPVVVAFVEPSGRWWLEAGGSKTAEYIRMQVEELLPELQKRYRLGDDPSLRGIMGNRFYALSAAYAAVKHPDVFGSAGMQSVYLGLGAGDDLAELLRKGEGSSVRFYLDWNRYDERNVDRGYDFAEDSRELDRLLRDGGYHVVGKGGEQLDSRGWSGWRNRTDRLLTALFPLE